jgi:hypothetical protein
MARLKGSKDSKQRERRPKSASDKKRDNSAKVRQKARDEALQRERNGATFRSSLFRGSKSQAVAVDKVRAIGNTIHPVTEVVGKAGTAAIHQRPGVIRVTVIEDIDIVSAKSCLNSNKGGTLNVGIGL